MKFFLCALLFAILPLKAQDYISPVAISYDGPKLVLAGYDACKLDLFDPAKGKIEGSIQLEGRPTGLYVHEGKAYVTLDGPHGKVVIIDLGNQKTIKTIPVGHTPMSPVVKDDILYICNRFDNNVALIDLKKGEIIKNIPVLREPVSLCLSPDGKKIWVGNHLPAGRSDGEFTSADLTCLEGDQASHYPLSNGTQGIRGIAISPDGKHIAISHVLSRYQVPTTQLDRGWINTNAVTLVDTDNPSAHDAILLDDVDYGASNPWAVSFSPTGDKLIVTHAGIHEISVIDYPALKEKIRTSKEAKKNVNQLSFLDGIRKRIALPLNGPRSMVTDGTKVYIPGYFSDNLVEVTLKEHPDIVEWPLYGKEKKEPDAQRRGMMYFNDAALCFQAWESCASCHPDSRVDALNWDLMNDGIGNPKNTRSMFLSHRTPPVMTLGIRKNAETAVKAGFRHIQFVEPEEDHTASVDAYLSNMPQVASPFLRRDKAEEVEIKKPDCLICHAPEIERGALTDAARRGKAIFKSAGCVECHPHPYYTTKELYDLGTLKGLDEGKKLVVPTLVEVWRTAPYMHDGRATSIKEVITTHNPGDKRGKTSNLSEQELNDLVEYVQSL